MKEGERLYARVNRIRSSGNYINVTKHFVNYFVLLFINFLGAYVSQQVSKRSHFQMGLIN